MIHSHLSIELAFTQHNKIILTNYFFNKQKKTRSCLRWILQVSVKKIFAKLGIMTDYRLIIHVKICKTVFLTLCFYQHSFLQYPPISQRLKTQFKVFPLNKTVYLGTKFFFTVPGNSLRTLIWSILKKQLRDCLLRIPLYSFEMF